MDEWKNLATAQDLIDTEESIIVAHEHDRIQTIQEGLR